MLRHVLKDNADQARRADAFFGKIQAGEVIVQTSDIVIFEAAFTLERGYRYSRRQVRDALQPVIYLPGVLLPGKERLDRAFDLYVDLNISFPDAYHAVLMEQLGINEVMSFDHDFDRVGGITRVEP